MGILSMYICPDATCQNKERGKENQFCKTCGKPLKKVGNAEGSKILKMKKGIEKGDKKVLFSEDMSNEEIENKIYLDMANLAMQEAGSGWMHVGALLSFNSTQQLIGSGFKAIIDQNKLIIRQNELIRRELKKLNKE